ncbi:MAG: flagellar basal-body rod protein FlgF [Bradymonadia bacterium]
MASGIYTSMTGAMAQERALESVSHNLANALTPGFKRQQDTFEAIRTEVEGRISDPEQAPGVPEPKRELLEDRIGASHNARHTLWAQGALKKTDNTLDVALAGGGLFEVQSPDGQPRYTRNGALTLRPDGTLVSHQGLPIIDASGGTIQIPDDAKDISITLEGKITSQGDEIGQLKVVKFDAPQDLIREGGSLYSAPQGANPQADTGTQVIQGRLEQSTVNAISSMTQMIRTQRVFDFNTKAIQTYQQMDSQAATDIARP